MIGLDTNVLVRYLAGDPTAEDQVQQAIAFIDHHLQQSTPLFANNVVLCEAVWVLQYHYDVPEAELLDSLEVLAKHSGFVFEERGQLLRAIQASRRHKTDFADGLIAEINRARGCVFTASFDKKAVQRLGFTLPTSPQ